MITGNVVKNVLQSQFRNDNDMLNALMPGARTEGLELVSYVTSPKAATALLAKYNEANWCSILS